MATADPYRAYNFKLDIQGVVVGHFGSCDGLSIRVPSIAYREGGGGAAVRKLTGRPDYGDVTLSYGLTSSTELWEWLMTAVNGQVERRNASIILFDTDGVTEASRWNLNNAWVTAWRGARLDALGNEVAIETMTLAFETLERA